MINAKENFERNNCNKIILEKKDGFMTGQQFDVILANINKNVIQENQRRLVQAAKPSTYLLLSGLLKEDEGNIIYGFKALGFNHIHTTERNNWICILLQYQLKSQ